MDRKLFSLELRHPRGCESQSETDREGQAAGLGAEFSATRILDFTPDPI